MVPTIECSTIISHTQAFSAHDCRAGLNSALRGICNMWRFQEAQQSAGHVEISLFCEPARPQLLI